MRSLQVRELPDHIYARLREDAKREHRSFAQQAVVTIERGLGMESKRKEKRAELLDKVAADPPAPDGDRLPDPVKLIREDRER
ncbi:MAG: hypothetical protein R6V03_04275 [Kiritimatiellia bacterium]